MRGRNVELKVTDVTVVTQCSSGQRCQSFRIFPDDVTFPQLETLTNGGGNGIES
jgi:hypothetical protein